MLNWHGKRAIHHYVVLLYVKGKFAMVYVGHTARLAGVFPAIALKIVTLRLHQPRLRDNLLHLDYV